MQLIHLYKGIRLFGSTWDYIIKIFCSSISQNHLYSSVTRSCKGYHDPFHFSEKMLWWLLSIGPLCLGSFVEEAWVRNHWKYSLDLSHHPHHGHGQHCNHDNYDNDYDNHDNPNKVGEGRGRELLQLDEGEEGQVNKLHMIIRIIIIIFIMIMIIWMNQHPHRLFGMSSTYIALILQSFW